jgi:hypothetical protein
MTFKSIDEIPGVARADTAKGRAAFAAGRAGLLVVPLKMSDGARAAFGELTSLSMNIRGDAWRRRSNRADACSLFDTGGDWGHGGDMYETHIRLSEKETAEAGRLAGQMGRTLYGAHPGAAEVGVTMGQLARRFAALAEPQDSVMLTFVYGFDHAPGPNRLPMDAAGRKFWDNFARKNPSRVANTTYSMDAVLDGPGLIILADDPARHGWIAPDSSYHCDRDGDYAQWSKQQLQREQEAQQSLIERFGAALVPAGHMVITRKGGQAETQPVIVAQERHNAWRGVSAGGAIYNLKR